MIKTYTRRPEYRTVKAIQFHGDAYEIRGYPGIRYVRDAGESRVQIMTQNGPVYANAGDYIAWDSHGRPYPIAKEEFERIYEETA